MHSSGEWIGGVYPVRPAQNTPQGMGSAITYARRYSLSAMLGLAADDDDDGNAASGQQAAQRQTEQRQTNGNGAKPAAQPAQAPQNDNPFNDDDKPSEAQHKMLFAVGVKVYGKDDWEAKRAELVRAVTNGRTESSTELHKAEMKKLLDGLKKKENEMTVAA